MYIYTKRYNHCEKEYYFYRVNIYLIALRLSHFYPHVYNGFYSP